MIKKHIKLESEKQPGEALLPKPMVTICDAEVPTEAGVDSCADITPTNAELLKLADKYPPPSEWLQADDVDSFFDGE